MKFWRCANRNCGVLLHTNLNNQFVRFSGNISDHSHLPNPAASEIRTLREQMQKRAKNEILPLQEIAEQEVRKGLLTGHNVVHNRRKLMPPLSQPCSFGIPDVYKKDFLNRDRLLSHDSHDPQFEIDEPLYPRPEGRVLMDGTRTTNDDDDVLFQYKTYEEFRTARLKLNYESSLKLWYSLPSDLASIDNNPTKNLGVNVIKQSLIYAPLYGITLA
ncbi:unnamed protein product [Didymodactylos carnosus]|uniref:FLYWCH-type domain-containing protein n=1 Tax=Didymodactylos carnosus TaxID=1234261 RepID=A0A815QKD3_9BILA|nr:unnamed protein product [Didymodactylos carnosus]CAF4332995.1 unnamed protein product [Didymodactylos carnosus]